MAHSKAPWHVNAHQGSDRFLWSGDGTEPGCIARLNQLNPNAADNESLILAAPKLLEALRSVTDWMREHTGPHQPNSPHDRLVAAMAAIAEATNEAPAGWTHAETSTEDQPETMTLPELLAAILRRAERGKSYGRTMTSSKDICLDDVIRLAERAILLANDQRTAAKALLTELDLLQIDRMHPIMVHSEPLRSTVKDSAS